MRQHKSMRATASSCGLFYNISRKGRHNAQPTAPAPPVVRYSMNGECRTQRAQAKQKNQSCPWQLPTSSSLITTRKALPCCEIANHPPSISRRPGSSSAVRCSSLGGSRAERTGREERAGRGGGNWRRCWYSTYSWAMLFWILRYTSVTMEWRSSLNLICSFWWWLRHWSGVRFLRILERRQKTLLRRRADSERNSRLLSIMNCRQTQFSWQLHSPTLNLLLFIWYPIFFAWWYSGSKLSSSEFRGFSPFLLAARGQSAFRAPGSSPMVHSSVIRGYWPVGNVLQHQLGAPTYRHRQAPTTPPASSPSSLLPLPFRVITFRPSFRFTALLPLFFCEKSPLSGQRRRADGRGRAAGGLPSSYLSNRLQRWRAERRLSLAGVSILLDYLWEGACAVTKQREGRAREGREQAGAGISWGIESCREVTSRFIQACLLSCHFSQHRQATTKNVTPHQKHLRMPRTEGGEGSSSFLICFLKKLQK